MHLALHTEAGQNFALRPETMQLLADRKVELLMDIYAYGDGDD